MWCFVLVHNDTSNLIENLSAQVTLVDADEILGQCPGVPTAQYPAAWCILAVDGLLPASDSLPMPAPRPNC